MIACLDDKSRKRFLAARPASKDGDRVTKLFRHLSVQQAYSETDLLDSTGDTKRIKNRDLELLGEQLVAFIGEGRPEVLLQQILVAAPVLIEKSLDKQAVELIEWGLELAEQSESYQVVQDFWRMAEMFPEPRPRFRGMTYDHALACNANLVAYRQIEVQLRKTPTIEDPDERSKALEAIESSPLLESPGMALGYESRLLYWRIKAASKYLLRKHGEAIVPQRNLVDTLSEKAPESMDHARRWIKEAGSLALLIGTTRDFITCKATWEMIANFESSNSIIRREKAKQIFPAMITLGIDTGDVEFASWACSEALRQMADDSAIFSIGHQTDILFHCASFFLAVGRISESSKMLLRLKTIPKNNFRAPIFAMFRLLEIIQEIEEGAYDDAQRLAKNLRMAKPDHSVPGANVGINLLSAIANAMCEPSPNWKSLTKTPSIQRMVEQLRGQIVLDYFNLEAWLEAKSEGRRMMDIIFAHLNR